MAAARLDGAWIPSCLFSKQNMMWWPDTSLTLSFFDITISFMLRHWRSSWIVFFLHCNFLLILPQFLPLQHNYDSHLTLHYVYRISRFFWSCNISFWNISYYSNSFWHSNIWDYEILLTLQQCVIPSIYSFLLAIYFGIRLFWFCDKLASILFW